MKTNGVPIRKAIEAFEELATAMAALEKRRKLARDAIALSGVNNYGNVRVVQVGACTVRKHTRHPHIRVYRVSRKAQ